MAQHITCDVSSQRLVGSLILLLLLLFDVFKKCVAFPLVRTIQCGCTTHNKCIGHYEEADHCLGRGITPHPSSRVLVLKLWFIGLSDKLNGLLVFS